MKSPQLEIRVIDSAEHAQARRRELHIDRQTARRLGEEAVRYIEQGWYPAQCGRRVDWSEAVERAREGTVGIPPDADLSAAPSTSHPVLAVEVANETALTSARRLVAAGRRPLVLNMANGVHPGGGFLHGARAQEESLCRSSALYATLVGDPMYAAHARRPLPDSTDWAILSPDVPVFRDDEGAALDQPWPTSFITCAAPYAPGVGQPAAGDLLDARIGRLLQIARAYGYTSLVLGAWGCGAFGNDPVRTAASFRRRIEHDAGAFEHITFAITDWSPERRLLSPFAAAFSS
ncbi:MAG: TIGR02452 family protein [Dermatophilaceae bacterium]|nr:TIGR02452 family protein [Intrasporangiaceae bacterium]